jgi:hypothetical protein
MITEFFFVFFLIIFFTGWQPVTRLLLFLGCVWGILSNFAFLRRKILRLYKEQYHGY